ncbi:EamA family transporter [Aestuariivirga litoralis]|uniref:EamA family transporter n=1 Tax=Aestuariivirga litoralis TaxID=2650924 RepID=UPI0018C61B7E|nr:EamA family transporter [Aestuariivirga litoralis]MBG1232886.1 EamA family transporter [Aestuariivirga litoralis]
MSPFIFALVLVAAFLHASWNVVVKISADRFHAMYLLQVLMGVMGLGMLMVFPFPLAAAWPYVIASGLLHTGYNVFLARSYKHGDLGLVYPVARGTAPLLTLIGTQIFAQDVISSIAKAGIITLIIGIWLIALSADVFKAHRATFIYALITSLFIGCYTVVDGLGGRVAGDASGYTGLLFVLDGAFMLVAGYFYGGMDIIAAVLPKWKAGLFGGIMSGLAYWIVIWAMASAPIAAVAALRETSILFALAFSARLLKEPMSWRRVAGVFCVVAGAVALHG